MAQGDDGHEEARRRLVVAVNREDAAALVRRYFEHDRDRHAGFTGAWFERIGGRGDHEDVADRFTAADIVAVSTLAVSIPPFASIELLHLRAEDCSALLKQIPQDANPGDDQGREQLEEDDSAANELWKALTKIDGIGWVTANKLLARKRPALLPVYDSVVSDLLGNPEGFWKPLAESWDAIATKLGDIHREAGAEDVSLLRTLDILLWRIGKEEGSEALVSGS